MDFNYALDSVGKFEKKNQKVLTFLLCIPVMIGCVHVYVQFLLLVKLITGVNLITEGRGL